VNEPGIKLTTYFGERDRVAGEFLADALFSLYEGCEAHTSVLLRGIDGFGQRHHLHTDRFLTLSESLPAVSIAIDTAGRIERALPEVLELVDGGLISLERAVLASGSDLEALELPAGDDAQIQLTLYGGRSVRTEGQAGYVAAVSRLRASGAVGASVMLAVDGTLHGERRRARFFARNARVPLVLMAFGDAASIGAALPDLAALLDDPVATIERVQILKAAGTRFAERHEIPELDPSGLPNWQKLSVHVEEQAKVGGRPLYVELIRRLREAGAAGATVLRGVRAFYGEREPFADRLVSLRRNVPVAVIIVDTPAEVRRWWPVVDRLTAADGLVTSELVPTSHGLRPAGGPGGRFTAR
jgi:PII-like signaling protein